MLQIATSERLADVEDDRRAAGVHPRLQLVDGHLVLERADRFVAMMVDHSLETPIARGRFAAQTSS